jgi:DNA-binding ferritin-like protein (Dps family)
MKSEEFEPYFFNFTPAKNNDVSLLSDILTDHKDSINDVIERIFTDTMDISLNNAKKYLDESIKELFKKSVAPHVSNNNQIVKKSNNDQKTLLDLLGDDLTKTIVVLVDYENVGRRESKKINDIAHNSMNKNRDITIKVLKFISCCNPESFRADIVVQSNRKDAADHYIGYCVGILESHHPPPLQIHVISKDHFACCLQDFCNNVIQNPSSDDFSRTLCSYGQ